MAPPLLFRDVRELATGEAHTVWPRALTPALRARSLSPSARCAATRPRLTQAFGALEKVPSGRGSVDMLVAGDPPERARTHAHARTGARARTRFRTRRDVVRGLRYAEQREEELA